jgi:hypothetical protein
MSQNDTLVSIVLPTYNGSRFLRESIRSCLGQTYAAIELVIVDDGSSAETAEIIESLNDTRVRKIRHPVNRGLPAALNTGFVQATGEYLTWTSDDNLYDDDAIQVMVEYLDERRDIDFVYTDFRLIDEEGQAIDEMRVRPPESLRESNYVGACFLYRRAVYETLGDYNPAARLAEDYEYWVRVSRQFNMAVLHGPRYSYRMHGGSLTGTLGGHAARRVVKRVAREHGVISAGEYRRALADLDVDEGFFRYQHGDLVHARALLLKGIAGDVTWLKNRGVVSILLQSFGLSPRPLRRSLTGKGRG